jgi:uncharacterized membrane protein
VDQGNDDYPRLKLQVERLAEEVRDLERRVRELEGRPAPQPVNRREAPAGPTGLAAVNRIGALTLAIGIIFFFKYAVDNRWIGAGGRILLGLIAGSILIALGDRLRARDQIIFGQGIGACGLATLYITGYAAFSWYHFVSQLAAAIALMFISALAVALSLRYSHPAIAALGFTSALLTPVLLNGDRAAAGVIVPFLFAVDGTCVLIEYKRGWAFLAPFIGAETMIAALYLNHRAHPEWFPGFALAMGLLHLAAAKFTRAETKVHDTFFATGHGWIVVALLRAIVLWTRSAVPEATRSAAESEFGSLFLAGYGVLALAWGIARTSPLVRSLGLVLISLVIAKLYLWDVWFLERLYRMSAFGCLGILLLTASWIYSRSKDLR